MKTTRLFLSLLFILCTFNAWAQTNEQNNCNAISETKVSTSWSVVINNQQVDGSVSVKYGTIRQGYTIWKDQDQFIFESQFNLSPGQTVIVEAYIFGEGQTNTIELTVPEMSTSQTLFINISHTSMHQLDAYFH